MMFSMVSFDCPMGLHGSPWNPYSPYEAHWTHIAMHLDQQPANNAFRSPPSDAPRNQWISSGVANPCVFAHQHCPPPSAHFHHCGALLRVAPRPRSTLPCFARQGSALQHVAMLDSYNRALPQHVAMLCKVGFCPATRCHVASHKIRNDPA